MSKKGTSQDKLTLQPLSGSRQAGESDKAVQACNDYLRMGSGRSVNALLEKYATLPKNACPSDSFDTLCRWRTNYKWIERASVFDAAWEERKTKERESVLGYGLAHTYERVKKLFKLAEFLEAQLYERGENGNFPNVFMPDVKFAKAGNELIRVDIERFNGAILEQYRKTLDDIAMEVGGRAKVNININVDLVNRAVDALTKAGLDPSETFENLIAQALEIVDNNT